MKKAIFTSAIAFIMLIAFNQNVTAQVDRPYTEGSLWQVDFIKTKSGMGDQYLKNLSEGWIKVMRAAKQQGYILDFKVLSAQPASESDWDLMLIYEIKNYAMLDGMTEKMDALLAKVFTGGEDFRQKEAISRNDLRILQGGKLTQELKFK